MVQVLAHPPGRAPALIPAVIVMVTKKSGRNRAAAEVTSGSVSSKQIRGEKVSPAFP